MIIDADKPVEADPPAPARARQSGWKRLQEVVRTDMRRMFNTGVPHVLVLVASTRGMLFIQRIALARILTQENLGRMSYVVKVLMIITVLADLGMCTGVLKYASEPISDEERNALYRTGMLYGAVSSCLLACLYLLAVLLTGGLGGGAELYKAMLVMTLFIPMATVAKTPPLFMQARKEIKKASTISMFTSMVGLVLVIGGAAMFGLWGYFVAMILGPALQVSVFVSVTRRFLKGARSSFAMCVRLLRFGAFALPTNFSGVANAALGVLMLKWLTHDDKVVAVFAVATYVQMAIRMLPQGLLQTAFPYLSRLLSDPPRLRHRVRELAIKQFVVVGAVTLGLIAVGYWAIPLVFGAEYKPSFWPAVALSLGLMAWSFGSPFGQSLMAMDRVHLNLVLSLTQLAISVAFCITLIPRHGALGAALGIAFATAIAAVLWVAVGSYQLRHYQPRAGNAEAK